jgi:hypothetical protein
MIVWVIGAVWMVGCMALIWEARRTPITPSDYANEPRNRNGSEKAEQQYTVRTDTNIARTADSEYKEDNWNRGIPNCTGTEATTMRTDSERKEEQERLIREAVEAFVDADWQYQEWLKTQGELQSQKESPKGIGFYNGRTDNE